MCNEIIYVHVTLHISGAGTSSHVCMQRYSRINEQHKPVGPEKFSSPRILAQPKTKLVVAWRRLPGVCSHACVMTEKHHCSMTHGTNTHADAGAPALC